MKRKTILALLTLTVCMTFMGCSKGSVVNTSKQSSSTVQAKASNDNTSSDADTSSADSSEFTPTYKYNMNYESSDDKVGTVTLLGYEEMECYTKLDDLEIKNYSGPNDREIDIPAEIDGAPVVEVGGFSTDCSIRKVTLPASVKIIRSDAFLLCRNLEEVVIEDGVESIGSKAFALTKIKEITIPSSVTEIGGECFTNSKGITIHGEAGSYIETYCAENDLTFEAIQ